MADAPARAGFVLRLIGQLYHYGSQWREANPALHAALRQGHFGLTLALLRRSAQRPQQLALPRSRLGEACAYLLGDWQPLIAHLDHGRTQLDTNPIEYAIRPSKLGQKNWLFVGHPDAGDRRAVIYSLLVSAQHRGLDPHAYLKDVRTRLPTMTTKDDLAPCFPLIGRLRTSRGPGTYETSQIVSLVLTTVQIPCQRPEAPRAALPNDAYRTLIITT